VLLATVLALTAAALHAAWNLIAKSSDDPELALVGQFAVGGVVSAALLPVVGLPGGRALPWLACSTVVHVTYVLALVRAYHHGDFSFAYPVARGGGALLAAISGVALLGDDVAAGSWVAFALVAAGLVGLVGTRPTRASITWAAVTAATIGTYTALDAHGSRISTSGQSYGLTLLVCTGVAVALVGVARGRRRDLAARLPIAWRRYLVAGVFGVAAYTLVLVAVRYAPVGYVTMLRESSVVLAALAGWLFLHERMGARRLACAGVILAGLITLVASSA
jgi:drug/metabolite transporter (DMT)-like permease